MCFTVHRGRCLLRHEQEAAVDLCCIEKIPFWALNFYVGRSAPVQQRRVPSTSPRNRWLSRLINTDRSAVPPTRVAFRYNRSEFKLVFNINSQIFFADPASTQFLFHSRDLILEPLDRTRLNLNEPADILLFLWILRFGPIFVPCYFFPQV